MDAATILARIQFAFTIGFHYLFPQLTMGMALLLVILKSLYLWRKDERYNISARFWGKIFAITFVVGVVTGIPMEFQFGTNWARLSVFDGEIIAQTLAMDALVFGCNGLVGNVGIWYVHYCLECMDAAPCRLYGRC